MQSANVIGLVVDLQNDYCHPEGALAKTGLNVVPLEAVIKPVNAMIGNLRRLGAPVIFLQSIYTSTSGSFLQPAMARHGARSWNGLGVDVPFVREGHWGSELHAALDVAPTDCIVTKRHYDGFFNSELGQVLQKLPDVRTMVVMGVTSDVCVMFTSQEAFQRGYDVIVPEHCVDSYEADRHAAALKVLNRTIGRVLPESTVIDEVAKVQTRQIKIGRV